MHFQASDFKGRTFLELNNLNGMINPSYFKGGAWMRHIGHSNSLCTQVTRLITNHKSCSHSEVSSPILLSRGICNPEMSVCPCRQAPLETHVLFEYTRYNGVVGDTLDDIIDFLERNPDVFLLQDNLSHYLSSPILPSPILPRSVYVLHVTNC